MAADENVEEVCRTQTGNLRLRHAAFKPRTILAGSVEAAGTWGDAHGWRLHGLWNPGKDLEMGSHSNNRRFAITHGVLCAVLSVLL